MICAGRAVWRLPAQRVYQKAVLALASLRQATFICECVWYAHIGPFCMEPTISRAFTTPEVAFP